MNNNRIPLDPVEEEMEQTLRAEGIDLTQRSYVYALECETFFRQEVTPEAIRDEARKLVREQTTVRGHENTLNEEPVWLDIALKSEALFYIGVTDDLPARLATHTREGGAWFTKLFKPTELVQLDYFRYREEAELIEKERRGRLNNFFDEEDVPRFAYSDLKKEEEDWQSVFDSLGWDYRGGVY